MASVENVLKKDSTTSLSDQQKYVMAQEYNKLYKLGEKTNNDLKKEKYDNRIYNLSLKEIYENFMRSMIDIMNDLIDYFSKKNKNLDDLMNIFVKDDRMIYFGIFLVIMSFALYYINASSSE